MHQPMQMQGYRYGFDTLWRSMIPSLKATNINYANLETPLADGVLRNGTEAADPGPVFDNYVYSEYPEFNVHSSFAKDIAKYFDVVSTANNHSLDRKSLGADKTIDALNAAGLAYTGIIKRGAERQWHTIVKQGRWKIAFIACTFSTNGIEDSYNQVLGCFSDRTELLAHVSVLAKLKGVDAVVVTPHWGNAEYTNSTDARNKTLGRDLINAGALAVIGTHPHVIQSWEKHVTPSGREGVIVYSTGNFISNQFFRDANRQQTRLGLMVFVGLTKSSGKVFVNGVKYMPIWMQHSPYEVVPLELSKDAPRSMTDLASTLLGSADRVFAGQKIVTNAECN